MSMKRYRSDACKKLKIFVQHENCARPKRKTSMYVYITRERWCDDRFRLSVPFPFLSFCCSTCTSGGWRRATSYAARNGRVRARLSRRRASFRYLSERECPSHPSLSVSCVRSSFFLCVFCSLWWCSFPPNPLSPATCTIFFICCATCFNWFLPFFVGWHPLCTVPCCTVPRFMVLLALGLSDLLL